MELSHGSEELEEPAEIDDPSGSVEAEKSELASMASELAPSRAEPMGRLADWALAAGTASELASRHAPRGSAMRERRVILLILIAHRRGVLVFLPSG
ncbi:hypothetical protein [Corynebacterium vitaeruminis]|uniref:hypothetical protein n=1 Tax=Corynebacterium vitaeruminis TaxID=38305 RepID=UPI000550E3C3|nr:hypothetical protein [Corynebacterium vitaeruminis]